MDIKREYLIFKSQGKQFKLRIIDIKRLYKLNIIKTPKIPCFENYLNETKCMNMNENSQYCQ